MQIDLIENDCEELLKTALAETEAKLKTRLTPKERVETLVEHMLLLKQLAEIEQ